jgi:signal transduction histidine kinase
MASAIGWSLPMTSLRTQLLVAVGGLAIAAVAVIAIAVRHETRQEFLRFEALERQAESVHGSDRAAAIARLLDGQCCDATLPATASRAGLDPDQLLLIVAKADGTLVRAAGGPLETLGSLATRIESGVLVIDAVRRFQGFGTQVRLKLGQRGASLRLSNGREALAFIMPVPSPEREGRAASFLRSLDRRVLFIALLVAGGALLAIWAIARGVTGPVRDLQSATQALARGDLGHRAALRRTGSREVRELSGAFNQMADALERQASLRQDLIRDVAHELRTPLTAVRCRVDAVLDGLSPNPDLALRSLLDDVRHLERLVDDLQDTALAEAGELRLTVEDLSLIEIIQSALRTADLASDPRLRVDVAAIGVRGDAVRVRQVLLNLLTNARRYTPADGTITVRGSSAPDGVVIEIHNSGSRLTKEELARVFDRFYRTDPSRVRASGGSGLGLAIVKHLVEAQQGRVWATSDASGVTVGFTLPAGALPAGAGPAGAGPAAGASDTARIRASGS